MSIRKKFAIEEADIKRLQELARRINSLQSIKRNAAQQAELDRLIKERQSIG